MQIEAPLNQEQLQLGLFWIGGVHLSGLLDRFRGKRNEPVSH